VVLCVVKDSGSEGSSSPSLWGCLPLHAHCFPCTSRPRSHPSPSTPLPLRSRRFEDVTPAEAIRSNPRCDRDVTLYGYVRGTNWKEGARVHIAGVGDYSVRGKEGAHAIG